MRAKSFQHAGTLEFGKATQFVARQAPEKIKK